MRNEYFPYIVKIFLGKIADKITAFLPILVKKVKLIFNMMLSIHSMFSFLKKIFVKSFYLLLPFFTCYNVAYNQETLPLS